MGINFQRCIAQNRVISQKSRGYRGFLGIDFLGITASAAVFVLRIDAVHIAVGEGFVNRLFDRVGRRRALHPGGIAAQRGGADKAVHHHKEVHLS